MAFQFEIHSMYCRIQNEVASVVFYLLFKLDDMQRNCRRRSYLCTSGISVTHKKFIHPGVWITFFPGKILDIIKYLPR